MQSTAYNRVHLLDLFFPLYARPSAVYSSQLFYKSNKVTILKYCSFVLWVPHPFNNGVFTCVISISMRSDHKNFNSSLTFFVHTLFQNRSSVKPRGYEDGRLLPSGPAANKAGDSRPSYIP